jgi:hypothetical protein
MGECEIWEESFRGNNTACCGFTSIVPVEPDHILLRGYTAYLKVTWNLCGSYMIGYRDGIEPSEGLFAQVKMLFRPHYHTKPTSYIPTLLVKGTDDLFYEKEYPIDSLDEVEKDFLTLVKQQPVTRELLKDLNFTIG